MGEIAGDDDRRSRRRFSAAERTFVHIKSDSYGLLYHLIEISNGGLSFRYFGEDILLNDSSELSILVEDNLYLTEIQVETISDTPMDNGYIPIRRIGVRFGTLSPMQKTQLTDFIENNTEYCS